jgi:hypothetical protein
LKCLKDDNSQEIGLNNTIIATILTPHGLTTGPTGLIKIGQRRSCTCSYPKLLSVCHLDIKNDPLSLAEHYTERKNSEKLDKKFVSKLQQEVNIISIQQTN